MDLYHSSKEKDYIKIIESQNFKIKRKFKYSKYVDHLIDTITIYKNPHNLPGDYPGSYVQAPFMGHGIYCFNNLEDAEQYQSNGKVLKITIKEDTSSLNMDDEDVLYSFVTMLKSCREKIIRDIKDEETKKNYLLLVELIAACLYEDFENSQPAVAIILFFYESLLENKLPDLIIRTFSKSPSPYYLLKNNKVILKIS